MKTKPNKLAKIDIFLKYFYLPNKMNPEKMFLDDLVKV